MLKQRVITAIVLLAILLPALFYPAPEPFAAVVLLLIAGGAWEWARLNGTTGAVPWASAAACVLACIAAWGAGWLQQPLPWPWAAGTAAWVIAGSWLLWRSVPGWARIPAPLRLLAGLALLWLAWLAAARARVLGIDFLLSVLLLVWVADIAAYFAGRRFGTRFVARRLAPAISPGKSWEGAIGGAIGVLLLALVWVAADARWGGASLYSRVLAAHGGPLLLLAVLFLTAMSVVGDLVESLVKRSAGAKDSSGLLPGHGGVLDRVDALLPVLPMAMLLQGG